MSKPKIFNTRWKPYSIPQTDRKQLPDSKPQTRCQNVTDRPCEKVQNTGGTVYNDNDWINDLCLNGTHTDNPKSNNSSLSFDDLEWNQICGSLTEQSLFTNEDADSLKMAHSTAGESSVGSPFTPFDLEDLEDNVFMDMDMTSFPTPPDTPLHQIADSSIANISLLPEADTNDILSSLQAELGDIADLISMPGDDLSDNASVATAPVSTPAELFPMDDLEDEEPEMLTGLPAEALNELCHILDSSDEAEPAVINNEEAVETINLIDEGYATSNVSDIDSIDKESVTISVNNVISNDHVYAHPSLIPVLQDKPSTTDILQLLSTWYGFMPEIIHTAATPVDQNTAVENKTDCTDDKMDKASLRRIKNNAASRVTRAKRKSKHEDLFKTEIELQRKNHQLKQQIVEMQRDAELMRAILLKKLTGTE